MLRSSKESNKKRILTTNKIKIKIGSNTGEINTEEIYELFLSKYEDKLAEKK